MYSIAGWTLLLLTSHAPAQEDVIDPELRTVLQGADPNQELAVIVGFSEDVDVQDAATLAALNRVGVTDPAVLWIINSIAGKVAARAVEEVAELPGVVTVRPDENAVSPVGADREPPSPVRYARVTMVFLDGLTLSWKPAADNIGIAGYLLRAQEDGRGQRLIVVGDVGGTETTHTITGLKPGTGYRIWVQPYDAAGNRATISGIPPAYVVTPASGT